MNKQEMKFVSRILENLPEVPDDVMQGWIENPKALKTLLAGLCPSTFLTPGEEFTIATGPLGESFEKGFDPREFFKSRKGLWISKEFTDRVLSVAEEVMEGQESELKSWNLRKRVTDTEIRSKLPENHLVELWQIAKLIADQPNGEEGLLLTNNCANLFYVKGKGGEVFGVLVRWDADCGEWVVSAWQLEWDGRWMAGDQVLSRN